MLCAREVYLFTTFSFHLINFFPRNIVVTIKLFLLLAKWLIDVTLTLVNMVVFVLKHLINLIVIVLELAILGLFATLVRKWICFYYLCIYLIFFLGNLLFFCNFSIEYSVMPGTPKLPHCRRNSRNYSRYRWKWTFATIPCYMWIPWLVIDIKCLIL